jgi:hypothetical protein
MIGYNESQELFVSKHDLHIGDKVKLIKSWYKGELGFSYGKSGMPVNLMIGLVFTVEKINETSITIVIKNKLGQSEYLKAPYFALEVI